MLLILNNVVVIRLINATQFYFIYSYLCNELFDYTRKLVFDLIMPY